MRREFVFALLGFLGGFVIAAMVFWQSAPPPTGALQSGVSPVSTVGAADHGTTEHTRRPLVLSARESEGFAPVPAGAPQAKGGAEIFHETIGTLAGLEPARRQAAIDELVRKLRASGPEGFQLLRDYFRKGQDVKFPNGYSMVNGKYVQMPSLRAALLNALGDWEGTDVLELTREILRTTPRMSEASLAISQLEKKAPGVYRNEAIQSLQQLATAPVEKDGWMGGAALFDAIKQFKAPELLPSAEAFVAKNPWSVPQYMSALESLPANVRVPALQRFFANESMTKNLESNPWGLLNLNYAEPVVAQNVARMFASNTDKRFRENFLMNFPNGQNWNISGNGVGVSLAATEGDDQRVARLRSRLAFLDQLAPQITTPALQERWEDARAALQKAIATPQPPAKAAIGGIQVGGSTTVIQGDSIQVLQIQQGK